MGGLNDESKIYSVLGLTGGCLSASGTLLNTLNALEESEKAFRARWKWWVVTISSEA